MRELLVLGIVVLFVCLTANAGEAAARCGNFSIEVGKHMEEVEHYCGEPETRADLGYKGRKAAKKTEKWIYGPEGGYIQIIYFEGGVVSKVEEKKLR